MQNDQKRIKKMCKMNAKKGKKRKFTESNDTHVRARIEKKEREIRTIEHYTRCW